MLSSTGRRASFCFRRCFRIPVYTSNRLKEISCSRGSRILSGKGSACRLFHKSLQRIVAETYLSKKLGPHTPSTIVTVQSTDVFDPVTNQPFEQTCSVTIKPIEAESIKLNKTKLTPDPGTFESLIYSFIPENTTNKKITWQSNNSKVVKVTYDAAVLLVN